VKLEALVGLVVLIIWTLDKGILGRGKQGGESLLKQEGSADEILGACFAGLKVEVLL
jgi:hypothetical protein